VGGSRLAGNYCMFWVLHFLGFRVLHLLKFCFVVLSAERGTGHTHDTPAILLVLSLELRETDFDLNCSYRLSPP